MRRGRDISGGEGLPGRHGTGEAVVLCVRAGQSTVIDHPTQRRSVADRSEHTAVEGKGHQVARRLGQPVVAPVAVRRPDAVDLLVAICGVGVRKAVLTHSRA